MASSNLAVLPHPRRITPNTLNRKIPQRLKNADYRSREYLTEQEVEQLMGAAAQVGRHGHRDSTLILLSYRHGLRVTELVNMRWDQVDLKTGLMHVNRLKQGNPSVHPLGGPELRALRRLQRDYTALPYVFSSERKTALSPDAFSQDYWQGRGGGKATVFSASAYVAPCLWLQAGTSRAGHASNPALPRSQKYPAHRPLYPAIT